MATPKVKTFLGNPVIKFTESGKVESITGTCSKRGCKNTRTIHAADAFQVRFCQDCQKQHRYAQLAAKRKARKARRS